MTPKSKFEQLLDNHTTAEEEKFATIISDIRTIKENHLAHIEADMGALGNSVTKLVTNYDWIKWIVTTTLGAVMVGVVAAVLALITK